MSDEKTEKADEKTEMSESQKKDIREKKVWKERAEKAEASLLEQGERLAKLETDQKTAEEAARTAENLEKGEFEKELAAQKASMQEMLDAKDATISSMQGSITDMFGTQAIIAELGAQGATSEYIAQAASLVQKQITVEYVDGAPKVTANDADGNPLFVEGAAGTVKDVVGGFLTANPIYKPPTGDGGSGRHPGGPGDPNAGMTQQALLANPAEHAKFIAKYDTAAESGEAFRKLPVKKE